jgi:uncharacterized protein (DUF488 family)
MTVPEFDVYTLGFSNRTWDVTVAILESFQIGRLVDIRTLPGSRFAPQFNQEHLERALPAAGVEYIHMKKLGGLRKLKGEDPTNAGLTNAGFRAYADYMQTEEFRQVLDELIRLFQEKRTVYVCTEAVFWRCHRALVSDALTALGYKPGHIFGIGQSRPHKVTSFARICGSRVTYPKL